MKTLTRFLLTTCLLATTFVLAQAPPPDEPPPVDIVEPLQEPLKGPPPIDRQRKMEKVTYLGIYTAQATKTLRKQLNLPDGVGLTIIQVAPDSPAADAGLQKHDVITMIKDQHVINQPQFTVLVRMFKPKDEVELKIIRKGKEQTIKATLGERMVAVNEAPFRRAPMVLRWNQDADNPDINVLPPEAREALKQLQMNPDVAKMLGDLFQKRGDNPREKFHVEIKPDGEGLMNKKMHSTYADGKHSLKVTTDENGKHLKVTDAAGKVVYDGPLNTEEDVKALPEEIQKKLDRMGKRFWQHQKNEGKLPETEKKF